MFSASLAVYDHPTPSHILQDPRHLPEAIQTPSPFLSTVRPPSANHLSLIGRQLHRFSGWRHSATDPHIVFASSVVASPRRLCSHPTPLLRSTAAEDDQPGCDRHRQARRARVSPSWHPSVLRRLLSAAVPKESLRFLPGVVERRRCHEMVCSP